MDDKEYYRRKRRPYPWDGGFQHYHLEDILSDECDKDSGYEPDQGHFWPRSNGTAAKRANFKTRKQRSLDVHDVSADYYALLSPHIGSDSSYNGYDPSCHDTSLYNQIRYQSLDRPVKRRRKVPESILKNGYNSLPRGTSQPAGQQQNQTMENFSNVPSDLLGYDGADTGGGQVNFQGAIPSNINQSRNSVKFASPVRYSANSDIVDTSLSINCNGNGPLQGNANLNLSNETSKATSDALTLRSVASTFPFVEPANSNLNGGLGYGSYDPTSLVEDKWKTSLGSGQTLTGNGTSHAGQNGHNNGNLKQRYNDNDHYLRKSASVQIIAHEPSRCEGCFDGRLPLLLIVVFIALVLFLLCVGVILDAEVFSASDVEQSTMKMHQTTEPSIACQKLECSFGALCRVDPDNDVAACHCDFQCSKTVKSVCGSDGLTYDNDCERRSAQCKAKMPIDLVKNGPCVKDPCENVECPANQECLASFDGASARCACKGPCLETDNPGDMVCGSDGVDYPSLCHLEKESCVTGVNISPVFNGSCDPCQSVTCGKETTCHVDQGWREATCSCVATCIDVVEPVCASNGKTYRNQCTMNQDSCQQTADLIVVHAGECNKESVCARLNCNQHATCRGSGGRVECTCPTCPPVYTPVCGNNNQTYNSECELYRTACETNDNELELDYVGLCTARPCSQSVCETTPHSTCGPDNTCHCPTCRHVFEPVCGDNRVLYDNLCLLQRAACLKRITIKRQPLPFCGEYESKKFNRGNQMANST